MNPAEWPNMKAKLARMIKDKSRDEWREILMQAYVSRSSVAGELYCNMARKPS